MPPPNDDSSPPWRLGTPHDVLSRFTSLLGTFVLKESDEHDQSFAEQALAPKHDGLLKLLTNDATDGSSLSFPSLLLMEEDHTNVDGLERSEVEAKAALSMAKVLTPSGIPFRAENHVESDAETENIKEAYVSCHSHSFSPTQVPKAMLTNLATSFGLLVDARLRAYTTILARHGVSLAVSSEVEHRQEAVEAIERKLDYLIGIGSRISIDNMVTSFQPQVKMGMSRTGKDGAEEMVLPFVMSAVLDITIPDKDDGHKRVTVSLQALGAIAGTSTYVCSFISLVMCFVLYFTDLLVLPLAYFRVSIITQVLVIRDLRFSSLPRWSWIHNNSCRPWYTRRQK